MAQTHATAQEALRETPQTIAVRSDAFEAGRPIPREHSGHGDDVSPPLSWSNVPDNARAIAIVVDDSDAPPAGGPSSRAARSLRDPDAPRRTFTHWTVWNLPPRERGIPRAAHVSALGASEGTNDFGVIGWRGPKPPSGTHRYVFHVIALDDRLALEEGARVDDVWRAVRQHALAWGETTGTFTKP